ncbi:MAG: hypothetical protein M1816_000990 [Peltula sp. TS41687]|nr:MAG: hypothetical protein M1816_000990 [Peltula sp. TS41687]
MTRAYGHHKCLHCQQYPSRGWVYKCVQDEDRALPFYFRGMNHGPINQLIKMMNFTHPPSEIGRLRQYNLSHLKIIAAQRQHVAEVIAAAYSPAASGSGSDSTEDPASSTTSSTDNTPGSSDSETEEEGEGGKAQSSTPSLIRTNIAQLQIQPCNWTCCHRCRRQLADRAWISLNAVVEHDYDLLDRLAGPDIEKPSISPLNVVRNLGLRDPIVRAYHRLRTFDQRDFSDLEEEDEEDVEREAKLRNLRMNLRKAFRDRMMGGAISVPPPIPASSPVVVHQQAEYKKFLPVMTMDGDGQSDLGLGIQGIRSAADQGKEILEMASQIELPGEEDGNDEENGDDEGDFAAEPVEVEGGIAVTEEAVEMNTADILTQA